MNNYTKVSNQVLEDATLSLKAKGLFAYLVKLPEGWKIRIGEIAKHHRDGYDSVHSALNELLAAGYLERFGRSRDKGQVGDWQYHINTGLQPDREKPVQENPHQVQPDRENPVQVNLPQAQIESTIDPNRENPVQASPDREKPDEEKPDEENPDVYIKDLERKDLERKEKVEKEKTPLPAWLSKELWKDFTEHRKLLKSPITPLAESRILKTLEQVAAKHSEAEARQCLDTSIAMGWKGVFPPKAQAETTRYQSADEKNQAVLDNFLKEDTNGKQGNDSPLTEELGSKHWADHYQRPSRRVV